MSDLPPWAVQEEQFAEFCRARGLDETDEAFVLFERWIDGGDGE